MRARYPAKTSWVRATPSTARILLSGYCPHGIAHGAFDAVCHSRQVADPPGRDSGDQRRVATAADETRSSRVVTGEDRKPACPENALAVGLFDRQQLDRVSHVYTASASCCSIGYDGAGTSRAVAAQRLAL